MVKPPNTNAHSKVTSKFQATIPSAIRKFLALEHGDTVMFEVIEGQVVLRRELPLDNDYLDAVASSLSKWNSAKDEEAYAV